MGIPYLMDRARRVIKQENSANLSDINRLSHQKKNHKSMDEYDMNYKQKEYYRKTV